MPEVNFKKILCVSTTGMGNSILYLPVIRSLRRNFSGAKIDLIISSVCGKEFIEKTGEIDKFILIDKKLMSLLDYARLAMDVRKSGYDLYVTSFLDKSPKTALLGFFAGIPVRAGFSNGWWKMFYTHIAPVDQKKHEVEYNLDLIRALGLTRLDDSIEMPVEDRHIIAAQNKMLAAEAGDFHRLFAVHPGSGVELGKNSKRWPAERFAELADAISEKYGWSAVILGSKDEEGLAGETAAKMKHKPAVMAGKTTINETAALIKMCKLLVTNDSGLMHVAAAVKVPVVAVFGPTLYWKNHPWQTRYRLLRLDMPCSPCYDFKTVKCGHNKCLTDLGVQQVMAEIVNLVRPS
ncbi:MAG: lipopolysaccharide heptosyltransferase II [Endomicrobiales bacterium]|nr:lipopolysaccharide heptosyltransferase II [Endomicrobiales bacterium]